MMKQIKKYALGLVVLLFLGSCSDSFFDLTPSNEISVNDFYKTADDFNQAIIACYARLQGQTSYYKEFSEYRSDNLYISAPTAGTQDRYDIDHFIETSVNGLLESYWANFNNQVYRCNAILDRIDAVNIDESLQQQYKGEALFLRALAYFNMYRLWGTVPVTRTVVSPEKALKIGRCTEEEMFKYLSDDLGHAAELLPASFSGDDLGRATSGAANTLLAKVNLTFGKWEAAENALENVIGKYSLTSEPGDVFDVNNKMNSEVIFAVRFNKTVEGEGHGMWYTTVNPEMENSQSDALKNCFTANDKRGELISWVKIEGANTYVLKKYYDTDDPSTLRVGNDQILLRYADVLLMYAEALNELNSSPTSDALNALNKVRKRAGLTDLQLSDAPDKNTFRKAILLERQKEFPYEGHRWFDLVRMGAAKETMQAVGQTIEDYQLVFPIPQTELERINNTSLLWQNPNY